MYQIYRMSNRKTYANPVIASMVGSTSALFTDKAWLFSKLQVYAHELELRKSGVPFSELGISKRREDLVTEIISEDGFVTKARNLNGFRKASKESVAWIKLWGVMSMETMLSTKSAEDIANEIEACSSSEEISAVVIDVNSGGGDQLAAVTIYNAIKDCAKPVYTYARFMGSAALWATLPSKKIFASDDSARIGSIGVYTERNREVLNWYKENIWAIYSDYSEDKNKEFKGLLDGNEEAVKETLNRIALDFREKVQKHRNLSGNIEETLSGGVWNAIEAKERGLIDRILTKNEVLKVINRKFKNKTFVEMNVAQKISAQIGRLFGMEVSVTDETSPEELAETLEGLEPVAVEGEEFKALQESVNSTKEALAEVRMLVNGLQDEVAEIEIPEAVDLTELTERIETLESEKQQLAEELANLKGATSLSSKSGRTVGLGKAGKEFKKRTVIRPE